MLSILATSNPFVIAADSIEHYTDTSVICMNSSAINAVFLNASEAIESYEESCIDAVCYNYDFQPIAGNESRSNVSMDFSVIIDATEYPISVHGEVQAYSLSEEIILWEGPLRGTTEIAGVTYSVIAGFSKIHDSADIQVSVTMQSDISSEFGSFICFTFGEDVITSEIVSHLQSQSQVYNTQEFVNNSDMDIELSSSTEPYYYDLGTALSNFKGVNIYTAGQTSRGYYSSDVNRFVVGIKTNCSALEDYYEQTYYEATSSICSAEISLQKGDLNSGSYISCVYSIPFTSDSGPSELEVILYNIVLDILSVFGIPTSTISAIFGDFYTTVEQTQYTGTHRAVSFYIDTPDVLNTDNLTQGLPVVFQLDRSGNQDPYNEPYIFTTSLMYRTSVIMLSGDLGYYYYVETYDASKTVNITVPR